jgi:zinc transport system permease protein
MRPAMTKRRPAEILVEVEGVSMRLGDHLALDRVDLEVAAGEIVSLIGPNGAGKSTLVKLVIGILQPTGGHVRRRPGLTFSYVPQRLQIDPTLPLSVSRFLDLPERRDRDTKAEALALVGASGLDRRAMQALSGGEFQRVLLARALLRDPDLLVLDEPAQGVDHLGQADFFRLIDRIRQERGCGVLIVSHDLHLVMAATDRVVCLNRHVCCSGTPETMGADPAYRHLPPPPRPPALPLGRGRGRAPCPRPTAQPRPRARLMLPEFLLRGWLAGLAVAAVAGPLGCFVVWRRMAYFGDTLAHGALLGVTLGILSGVDLTLAVAVNSAVIALLVVAMQQQQKLASDTLLGILAHSGIAIGLVILGLVGSIRVDLLGYLFGDILAVTWQDVIVTALGGVFVLAVLHHHWQHLIFATLHDEMARAEGAPVMRLRIVLMLLIALVIAAAMKIVGILLITSMLIIPPAAARQVTRTPETMALGAALVGALAVTLGLAFSWHADTPAGASIVVAALALFLMAQATGPLLIRTR